MSKDFTEDDKSKIRKTFNELFYVPGTELVAQEDPGVILNFLKQSGNFLPFEGILNKYKQWALHLDSIWLQLSRKVKEEFNNSDRTTLIKTNNPFIVPGGRFNEFYYWDSYWIVKGLLRGNRFTAALAIVRNFLDFVDRFGFVPNGNRIYYLNRSQPPFLTQIVRDLFISLSNDLLSSNNTEFPSDNGISGNSSIGLLEEMLPGIEKEYKFWMTRRSASVSIPDLPDRFLLNVYNASLEIPRPEGYYEDWKIALQFNDTEDQIKFFNEIATGAETGWDFSSRFIKYDEASKKFLLRNIYPSQIVPVDLTSIMYINEITISWLYTCLNNLKLGLRVPLWEDFSRSKNLPDFVYDDSTPWVPVADPNCILNNQSLKKITILQSKASYYYKSAQLRKKALKEIHWDSDKKVFLDYDLIEARRISRSDDPKDGYYASSFYPLWAMAFDIDFDNHSYSFEDLKSMTRNLNSTLFSYIGGIPNSMIGEEQWDFPNVWAPIQWIAVEAMINLYLSGFEEAKQIVGDTVFKFIRTTFCAWKVSKAKFEKRSVHKKSTDHITDIMTYHPTGMYEKYDARYIGIPGGGGEYIVQDGFGWTNGVVLDWLQRFGTNTSSIYNLPADFSCSITNTSKVDESSEHYVFVNDDTAVVVLVVNILGVALLLVLFRAKKEGHSHRFSRVTFEDPETNMV